MIDQLIKW